jgi:hypothetical protein
MDAVAYARFTQQLVDTLSADERVHGLVACGSMAGTHQQPDQWSDHDFLIVAEAGSEEIFRVSTDWLPAHKPIVLHFRETSHGCKVLYEDGHLLEYAIFDAKDFAVVRLNAYRVLIDRHGFGALVERNVAATDRAVVDEKPSLEHLYGQLLTHLLVGVTRYARGEKLSGHRFVKEFAIQDLLRLVQLTVPLEGEAVLDNLDQFRRFERAYPTLAVEIGAAQAREVPAAAVALLDFAEAHLPALNAEAARVVRARIG